MFGMTEGLVMAAAPSDPEEVRHGSVGYPIMKRDVIRLLQPGTERPGYYADDAANDASFTPDGFLRTGDLVREISVGKQICYVFGVP
jgi:non-ribosomal peptide synthetase component E (peptide arylation enzyme)